MKITSTRSLALIVLALSLASAAAAQETFKCYRLMALKNEDVINLKINGAKVTGEFTVNPDYDESNAAHYPFTGTVAGNVVTVKFTGKKPDSLPARATTYAWTMGSTATREFLRVKFYGKNYENNKYSHYFGEFDSCRPVYGFLAKSPKVVQFAKGQDAATTQVTFPDNKGYRTFSISARRGQTLNISALGCTILVYLPDKKSYEYLENPGDPDSGKASLGLDTMDISPLPQTGNYLVALQIAGDDLSPRTVSFKITH